ncbi:mechanosensitive ion channel family protein [Allohahella marinimesophila]|uniref:Mechanosensitive ion channel n=1 Tax=Allohahella marinimesophila TaxID=1054972 RepID=A0ABP7NRQ2_9GAMM
MLQVIEEGLIAWAGTAAFSLLAISLGFGLYKALVFVVDRFAEPDSASRIFLTATAGPLGIIFCLLALSGVLHSVPQDLPLLASVQAVTTLLLILAITWAAVGSISAIGEVIVKMNPALDDQWKRARKVETQTRFLVRCLNVIIVLVGISAALMTFDSVRQIGTSLLASAGIGGIILGFAARPVLSNMLAGMQIALTQPFRIDDVLHVQGEWCWVEEVTSTYVVLRIWDLRRLIVPLQWFIENPFQNWSRYSADLLGTTTIWADYGIPIDPLRKEFTRLLEESTNWDRATASVQVVEAGEKAIQIRFLMSARNSNSLWDLRCAMREGMISFIQENYPEYLPRFRAEVEDNTAQGPVE